MATFYEIHFAQVNQAMSIARHHNDWGERCRNDLARYKRIHRRICGRSYRVKMSLLTMLPVGGE